jgi:hypothetical protein
MEHRCCWGGSDVPSMLFAAAATAVAKAGQPDAARILTAPVSPGPPGGIPGLAGDPGLDSKRNQPRNSPVDLSTAARKPYPGLRR